MYVDIIITVILKVLCYATGETVSKNHVNEKNGMLLSRNPLMSCIESRCRACMFVRLLGVGRRQVLHSSIVVVKLDMTKTSITYSWSNQFP